MCLSSRHDGFKDLFRKWLIVPPYPIDAVGQDFENRFGRAGSLCEWHAQLPVLGHALRWVPTRSIPKRSFNILKKFLHRVVAGMSGTHNHLSAKSLYQPSCDWWEADQKPLGEIQKGLLQSAQQRQSAKCALGAASALKQARYAKCSVLSKGNRSRWGSQSLLTLLVAD